MTHSPDFDDDPIPPPDARCSTCGGTERLGPIVRWTSSPERTEQTLVGWMCAACSRDLTLRQMEEQVETQTRHVEACREQPLHRWGAERGARSCAAMHRRTLARLGEPPSPAVAAFIARHDPDGRGEAELAELFARGAQRPPHAPISDAEMFEAYRLLADDEEQARELAEDDLRHRAETPHGIYYPLLFLAVATRSPAAEARMRAFLREHHAWSDERFDESLAWARREVFERGEG